MECHLCTKNKSTICLKCHQQGLSSKRQQIKRLKDRIYQQKLKYESAIQTNFLKNRQQEKENHGSHINQSDKIQQFGRQIDAIVKRQNTLIETQKLRNKVKQKLLTLHLYKQQRKQKQDLMDRHQIYIKRLKQDILSDSQNRLKQMQAKIKKQSINLKHLQCEVKIYLQEVISNTFGIVWSINQNFIAFQKRRVFKLKQIEQLDFIDYNQEQDNMQRSFYQIQNLQQIIMKEKTSQKGIHVLFQNLLVVVILQKICDLWLPYPIDCEISFNQSKLVSKMQDVKICNQNLIDFGKSLKLTKNIIQFFPSKIANDKVIMCRNEQNCEQAKHLFQINQSAQYNKRKIQLNKSFVNCLQVNVQYLSVKHGIQSRPFVFSDMNLIYRVAKQLRSQNSYVQLGKNRNNQNQAACQNYRSMLKQIKPNHLIQSLLRRHRPTQIQQQPIFQRKVSQFQQDEQNKEKFLKNEKDKSNYDSNPNYGKNSKEQEQIQMSVYQLIVPDMTSIKSSQSDNNEFQLLS